MTNAEVVRYVYGRFALGDAAAIVARMDDNIAFRLAEGHPYQPEGKTLTGIDAVIDGFFKKADGEWDKWRINITDIHEMGDVVVVEGRYAGTYLPTGKELDAQLCHVWRFHDGKIKGFHQYVDTARVQQTMQPVAMAAGMP